MRRASDHPEFFRLLFDLIEDQLTADAAERLEEFLKSSAEFREIYADFMLEVSGLHRLCAGRAPSSPQAATRNFVAIGAAVVWRSVGAISTPAGFSVFFAALTMTSLLLFFAQIRFSAPPPASPSQVAVEDLTLPLAAGWLRATEHCRWTPDVAPGNTLREGQELNLRAGAAVVHFASGAKVRLVGPTRLRLEASSSARLYVGQIAVTAPPRARGFTVRTPDVDIVDLGTEFAVVVDEQQVTAVSVQHGLIRMQSTRRAASVVDRQLAAGESIQVNAQGVYERVSIATAKRLQTLHGVVRGPISKGGPTEKQLAHHDEARLDQKDAFSSASAGQGKRPGAAEPLQSLEAMLWHDSGLLIYYGSPSAEGTTVKNLSRAGAAYDGTLLGGEERELEEAFTPCVLHFEKVADGIAFNAPDPLPAFTLVARVRMDNAALRQPLMGLVMSYGWQNNPGPVHWQIQNAKTLCFAIRGHPRQYFVELGSSPLIGRWVHLAVTCDQARGRIVHYVDAQQVDEQRNLMLPAARFGETWIGNWNPTGYPYPGPQRNFIGDLAEFMLFRRALSAEQIEFLYRGGKAPSPPPEPNEAKPRATANPPKLEPSSLVK